MSRPSRSASSLTRIGRNSETPSATSAVIALIVSLFLPMRVSEDAEREGLDITSHGERAWEFD